MADTAVQPHDTTDDTASKNAPAAEARQKLSSQYVEDTAQPKTATASPDKSAENTTPSAAKTADKTNASADKPNEWTVAVDLTANKYVPDQHDPSKVLTLGAADKFKKLQELASESANKPVTFVVQLATHGDPHIDEAGHMVVGDGNANEPAKLERYRIKDGKIEELPAPTNEGFAKNLANLTRDAINDNPAKKVALILNSDGGGNAGFQGDDGRAQLSDVTNALKTALAQTDHKKLDLIDYDCCMMAEDGALTKTAEIAKTAVASAETERVRVGADGQNTPAELKALLDHPEMSATDLAKEMVEQANHGANDTPDAATKANKSIFDSGTNTLAAFDLSKTDAVRKSIDDFGKALDQVCADPASKKAVQDIISSMGTYGNEKAIIDADNHQERDLKLFAENIQQAIQSGKLKDDDQHTLANSAAAVINEQQQFTIARHGNDASNSDIPYNKAGDMSVFLPDKSFYDANQAMKNRVDNMANMVNTVANDADASKNPDNWDAKVRGMVCMGLMNYKKMFDNGKQSTESEEFWKDATALKPDATHDELVAGMKKLQTAMTNLQNRVSFDDALTNEVTRIDKMHRDRWQQEEASESPNWNHFVDDLSHT